MNSRTDYQPHAYVIQKDNGTIVANTTRILGRWEQFYGNLIYTTIILPVVLYG